MLIHLRTYKPTRNYPATDLSHFSHLVSVVPVVARITQLGSPLVRMDRT